MNAHNSSHSGPKSWAVGDACDPDQNFYSKPERNRVEEELQASHYCLVVDHRQSGKSTLARVAASNLEAQGKVVVYIVLRGVKVQSPKPFSFSRPRF